MASFRGELVPNLSKILLGGRLARELSIYEAKYFAVIILDLLDVRVAVPCRLKQE